MDDPNLQYAHHRGQPRSKAAEGLCMYCGLVLLNESIRASHLLDMHASELEQHGLNPALPTLNPTHLEEPRSLAVEPSHQDGDNKMSVETSGVAAQPLGATRPLSEPSKKKHTRGPSHHDNGSRHGTKAARSSQIRSDDATAPGFSSELRLPQNSPHAITASKAGPQRLPALRTDLGHPASNSSKPKVSHPPHRQQPHASHGQTHHDSSSHPAASIGFDPRRQLSGPPDRGIMEMAANSRWPGLLLQPDSRPISQEQLAAEVKSIYAGLVMVENKCINVDRAQASASQDDSKPSKLASDHWQALIALHRTLLHEHHDFFLASQHPSASPALRRLAAKYSMPARMWKHGIHSFLELLRRRLPESLDYMLAFIYLAYQMMALLYETVPAFEDTWIECLGDLGRYRMAIEDEDLRDRETWAGVARFWYSKAADKSPAVGRLYHHLAILARPNALQQIYYYSRSLTCVQPFMSARESIMTLLDPILGRTQATYSHAVALDASFIRAHGLLFVRESLEQFDSTVGDYHGQLDAHIGRITAKWKEQGVYVAVTNIASLYNYGDQTSVLRKMYELVVKFNKTSRTSELQTGSGGHALPGTPPDAMSDDNDALTPQNLDLSLESTFPLACRLTFSTFKLVVRRIGDKNVFPHVHVILAFLSTLSSLSSSGYDCTSIFQNVPWGDVAFFLSTLARSEKLDPAFEPNRFPRHGESDTKPLPEDYMIQGQIWSELYFPAGWFMVPHDEEERTLELASTVKSRIERILWLGVQIALRGPWLSYDPNSKSWSAPSLSPRVEQRRFTRLSPPPISGSSSEPMDIEVHSIPPAVNQLSYISSTIYDPMDGITHHYSKPNIDIPQEQPEATISQPTGVKNVILRNYTIFICEKTMLLQQSEVFLMLIDSGDWKVVIPESVVTELGSLSKSSGLWETAAEKALGKIRMAIRQGKNLHIADNQGNYLTDPMGAVERLAASGVQIKESAEDVAIGVTRRQSDLNAQGPQMVSYPGAKPAILVSEDKATRTKARAAGVTSIAASKIRRFIYPTKRADI